MILMSEAPKILIIDDEFIIHKLFISLLASEYTLLFASSGKQALEMFHREHPPLVLLDYQLKDMDGDEFLSKLQPTDLIRSKVVLISGHIDLNGLRPENRNKIAHFFSKPFLDLQKMSNTLGALIGRRA